MECSKECPLVQALQGQIASMRETLRFERSAMGDRRSRGEITSARDSELEKILLLPPDEFEADLRGTGRKFTTRAYRRLSMKQKEIYSKVRKDRVASGGQSLPVQPSGERPDESERDCIPEAHRVVIERREERERADRPRTKMPDGSPVTFDGLMGPTFTSAEKREPWFEPTLKAAMRREKITWCQACDTNGTVFGKPCEFCKGEGFIRK